MLLLVPHRFELPSYAPLHGGQPWLPVLLLLGGVAVLGGRVFAPPARRAVWLELAGAVPLLLLGGLLATGPAASSAALFTVVGLGAVADALARRLSPHTRGQLLPGSLGLALMASSLIALLMPGQFSGPSFAPVRPIVPLATVMALLAGAGVVVAQLVPRARSTAYLVAAAVCLLMLLQVALPIGAWLGIVYLGLFGAAFVVAAWVPPRRRVGASSLRLQLAFTLATVAALPLLAGATAIGQERERGAIERAMVLQRTEAVALAEYVREYIGRHRTAVASLAALPNLLDRPPAEQEQTLSAFNGVHSEITGFSTFDAKGQPIARSDGRPLTAARDHFVAEARDRGSALLITVSRLLNRPVFAFAEAVRDGRGEFRGIAAAILENERMSEFLAEHSRVNGWRIYIVDQNGSAIAHPDPAVVAAFLDLSDSPPVAAARQGQEGGASLRYRAGAGEWLAGYARVPGLDWGLIVEQPVGRVLAPARAERERLFAVVLLAVALAGALGWMIAGWLTGPLHALARATAGVARGQALGGLPGGGPGEVRQLTRAFDDMSRQLIARTAERERAEELLRTLNATLEARVADRTAELSEATERLQQEVRYRERAENLQRFLAEAGRALSDSLDYETTLQTVAHLAVPRIGDWCTVNMLQDDGSIRRLTFACADPANEPLAHLLEEKYPLDPGSPEGVPKVIRTGQAELLSNVPELVLEQSARDPEHLALLRQLGLRSFVCAPLLVEGRTVGAIALGAAEPGRYGPDDADLLEELARRAATAIHNTQLYRAARDAVRARDEFLSIAAHELKTPVTAISASAQLIIRARGRGQLSEDSLDRLLKTLTSGTARLTTLVNDLLDVSRIRMGQMLLRPRPTNLAELARAVGQRLEARLSDQHTLRLELPSRDCTVTADADRLEQVIENLLDNALKYSPSGGTVTVWLEDRFDEVVVGVRDEGIGLPEGFEDAIFRPFGRAANAAERHLPGMGLGLYICRRIVERHGGRIWAESEGEDRGTTVYVSLPRSPQPSPAAVGER